MLLISEIFGTTIQGEGRRVGYPSYFIRFGGCNFKCKGFGVQYEINGKTKYGCDSYYSVDPEFKKEWNSYESFHDIVQELKKLGFDEKNRTDIVITGGEPLLYWGNEEFQKLLAYFISRDIKVTIETNASRYIKFENNYQKEILFSMSVKLKDSGEEERKRFNYEAITNILENTKKSYFKFVVGKDTDIQEILDFLEKIPYYAPVYLMPLGETREKIYENAEYVANLCIKYGFYYSPRLHIDIWDNKRKV